jgi:hypothetical protein
MGNLTGSLKGGLERPASGATVARRCNIVKASCAGCRAKGGPAMEWGSSAGVMPTCGVAALSHPGLPVGT